MNLENKIIVDKLNASADYLVEDDLLFGEIKPIFELTVDGKIGEKNEVLYNKLKELGLPPDSLKARDIQLTYLLDMENITKRASAYDDRQRPRGGIYN